MRKKLLQVCTIILAISLLFGTAPVSFATEASTASSTDDAQKEEAIKKAQEALAEAKKEKESLEGALANAEALVKGLKQSKSDTQSKVNSLNSQLASIQAQITQLEEQLTALDADIETATSALAEAEEIAAKQYAAMKLRIQYIYENGNRSMVSLILSAKDISSFLNAIEYVAMLSKYDSNMLDEYEYNVAYIEAVKSQLEAEYETAKTMREEIGIQKQTVQVLKDAKTEELNAIGEELADAEEVARAYEAEVKAQEEVLAAIQATINAIEYGDSYLSGSGFCWPCPSYTRVSSEYGPRTAPTSGASTVHKGIDLAAPYGSGILASESGIVTKATYSSSAGNYIIVNHGYDSSGNVICTVYMHCSALYVSEGETVIRGQKIAAVGSTGVSTGNHLHFGVTVNGSYVSPWNYVSKP